MIERRLGVTADQASTLEALRRSPRHILCCAAPGMRSRGAEQIRKKEFRAVHFSWIRGLCRRLCRRDDQHADRIRQTISERTQWVASKPNAPETWQRVLDEVSDLLTALWRQGELVGKQADEAFFVRCDRSVMTQDDIDNGRLIVEVGVAPTKPAEFVIFRIGQFTSEARRCGPDGAR